MIYGILITRIENTTKKVVLLMSMSVCLHANNTNELRLQGYVTEMQGDSYAVVSIISGSGHDNKEVTLFLNQEQLDKLKDEIIKTSVEFQKHNAKKELLQKSGY